MTSPTLQDFVLNLIYDPAARSAFESDPEATLRGAGLDDVTAADVQQVIPLVVDSTPVAGLTGAEGLDSLTTGVNSLDVAGAVAQLQAITSQVAPDTVTDGLSTANAGLLGLNADSLGKESVLPDSQLLGTGESLVGGLSADHDPAFDSSAGSADDAATTAGISGYGADGHGAHGGLIDIGAGAGVGVGNGGLIDAGVGAGVGVGVGGLVDVGAGVGVGVGNGGLIDAGVGAGVGVGGLVDVGTGAGVGVGNGVDVGAGAGVGVGGVGVGAGVGVGLGDDCDTNGLDVGAGLGVGVGGLDVGLGLGVGVGSGLDVGLGLGVGVGDKIDAGAGAGASVTDVSSATGTTSQLLDGTGVDQATSSVGSLIKSDLDSLTSDNAVGGVSDTVTGAVGGVDGTLNGVTGLLSGGTDATDTHQSDSSGTYGIMGDF
ncbi:IniB N-terminal domain-containing protein [Actinoplanes couchii]|uniref:IniB N-terminal domain-containing protein n=1 Tax=Actinoplanes couchii TaxID=403638 RepID=UPI0031D0E496